MTHYSTSYQNDSITVREPSRTFDGTYFIQAKSILNDLDILSSDDLGYPIGMVILNEIGIPLRASFYVLSFLLASVAFIFLCVLYEYFCQQESKAMATVLMLYLILYPPGIYHSVAAVARILPAYALLVCLVVLLKAEEIFDEPLGAFFLSLVGVLLAFLCLARNTNKLLLACFFVGLGLKVFWDHMDKFNYFLFVGLCCCYVFVGNQLFVHQEHSFWHPVYLGLGDFDNKHGITQEDHYAYRKAKEVNLNLKALRTNIDLSPEYDPTMKKLTLALIESDPLWYAKLLCKRFVKILVYPFQGSWLFEGNGTLKYLTAGFDLLITILGGFIGLFSIISQKTWRQATPYLLLLSGVLWSYAFVMTSNRTLFLAGTMFYQSILILVLTHLMELWQEDGFPMPFKAIKSMILDPFGGSNVG